MLTYADVCVDVVCGANARFHSLHTHTHTNTHTHTSLIYIYTYIHTYIHTYIGDDERVDSVLDLVVQEAGARYSVRPHTLVA
jgi:hypothetical protein